MNERIKQLAEQAMVETQHEFGGKYLAFSKEKFAELIVQECVDICNRVYFENYHVPVQRLGDCPIRHLHYRILRGTLNYAIYLCSFFNSEM